MKQKALRLALDLHSQVMRRSVDGKPGYALRWASL